VPPILGGITVQNHPVFSRRSLKPIIIEGYVRIKVKGENQIGPLEDNDFVNEVFMQKLRD